MQFCSGKKFTAADVVYSFNRQRDPATRAPYAWRAGKIKELRAPDPTTVEYELTEPYSDLLVQLTMFNNSIHNKESVDALGKDYGVKGVDGTGPWCWVSWSPRTEMVLKRHDAYKWGPTPMYKNPGPVKFERLVIKQVPEDSSRLAAMMSGRMDITPHFPTQFIDQAKKSPMLNVDEAKPNFQVMYFGFKANRPLVSDKRVREAMNIGLNRLELTKSVMLGQADPAYTYIHPEALDFAPNTKGVIKEDFARANRLLDEAGWTKRDSDGIRMKDGQRLAPTGVHPAGHLLPAHDRGHPGPDAQDRGRLAHHCTRVVHHAGQAARPGLRPVDGDRALPLGRRADDLLLPQRADPHAQPHELEGCGHRRSHQQRTHRAQRRRPHRRLPGRAGNRSPRSTCGSR